MGLTQKSVSVRNAGYETENRTRIQHRETGREDRGGRLCAPVFWNHKGKVKKVFSPLSRGLTWRLKGVAANQGTAYNRKAMAKKKPATKETAKAAPKSAASAKNGDTGDKVFVGKSIQPEYLTLKLANRHGLITG